MVTSNNKSFQSATLSDDQDTKEDFEGGGTTDQTMMNLMRTGQTFNTHLSDEEYDENSFQETESEEEDGPSSGSIYDS